MITSLIHPGMAALLDGNIFIVTKVDDTSLSLQDGVFETRMSTEYFEDNAVILNPTTLAVYREFSSAKSKMSNAGVLNPQTSERFNFLFNQTADFASQVPLTSDFKIANDVFNTPAYNEYYEAVIRFRKYLREIIQCAEEYKEKIASL